MRALILLLLSASAFAQNGFVHLKDVSLYEQEETSEAVVGLGTFSQTVMLRDDMGEEVWGPADGEGCKDISYSEVKPFEGDKCIKMSWDVKGDCEWTGMGFGWSRWQGKNLEPILNTAAIEFYARVDSGSYGYMPIVFLLEDYSNLQAGAGFNPLCLNGAKITSEWTKVTVPLSTFSFKGGADASNVKQLIIQFMGKGDFYIDNMSIVAYENSKYRKIAADLPVNNTLPQNLFNDQLTYGWGINQKYCSNFGLSEEAAMEGSHGIKVSRVSQCDWDDFGFSWNGWERTDISEFYKNAAIRFYVKAQELGQDGIGASIWIEDYSGAKASVRLNNSVVSGKNITSEWTKVTVPLASFNFEENNINPAIMKQIFFKVDAGSQFYIDNIQFVKF